MSLAAMLGGLMRMRSRPPPSDKRLVRFCILTSLVQKACGFGLLRRTYMVACLPGQSSLCFSVCISPPAAGFLFSLQIPRMGAQAGPHGISSLAFG